MNNNLTVYAPAVSGCEFPPSKNQSDQCQLVQQKILNDLMLKINKNDSVIISNRHVLFEAGNIPTASKNATWLRNKESIENIKLLNEKIRTKGANLVLILPTPEFKLSIEQCKPNLFRPFLSKNCYLPLSSLKKYREDVYMRLNDLPENIKLFDPTPLLCFKNQCGMIDLENKPLYIDSGHITDYANRKYIYKNFDNFLKNNGFIKK